MVIAEMLLKDHTKLAVSEHSYGGAYFEVGWLKTSTGGASW